VLQVQVVEIPEKGLALKVSDLSWFPDQEVSRQEDLRAEVFLSRTDERVFVSGSIEFVLLCSCDRCLNEFELPRDITFRVVFDLKGEDPALTAKEYECDKSLMDVVFLEKPVIDLATVLSQQVILSLPLKNICRQDCRGICPSCGEDLNMSICSCNIDDSESPFGILGQLITKK